LPLPWILFCYHKGGTILLTKVFRSVAKAMGLRFRVLLGKPDRVPPDVDIALFGHSLLNPSEIPGDYRAVHVVRDPRDVLVSGYLYHLRCEEAWCVNNDLSLQAPIRHPRVPYSQEHRAEAWKRAYLESLRGRSYQDNLRALSQEEGIAFELDRYAAWTVEAMAAWEPGDDRVLEMRFEDVRGDFDGTFARVFRHLGLEGAGLERALLLAAAEDLNRKSDSVLASNPHISSRETTRWRQFLTGTHRAAFKERHGPVLVSLGYERDLAW
jgi:hypothetical protein